MADERAATDTRNRDRTRWQRKALRVLSDLLGNDPHLPVLSWTISDQGTVIGHVQERDTPDAARRQWEVWAAHLESTTMQPAKLTRWPESGTERWRRLHVQADHYEDLVTVSVLAAIDESGSGAPEEGRA